MDPRDASAFKNEKNKGYMETLLSNQRVSGFGSPAYNFYPILEFKSTLVAWHIPLIKFQISWLWIRVKQNVSRVKEHWQEDMKKKFKSDNVLFVVIVGCFLLFPPKLLALSGQSDSVQLISNQGLTILNIHLIITPCLPIFSKWSVNVWSH